MQTRSKIHDPFGEKEGAWLTEMNTGQKVKGRILGEARGRRWHGCRSLEVHIWWHIGGDGWRRMDGWTFGSGETE